MKNSRNIEQNNPVESVFNNKVDKDVQLMLWPLNLMQFISFAPKYCIRNNHITPNNVILNLFSIVGAIVFIFLFILRTYWLFFDKSNLGLTTFMTATAFVDFTYYAFGFTLNFVVGISKSKNNMKFVLIFQRLHRILNNETSFYYFIIGNWITVLVAFFGYFICFSYFSIKLSVSWFYYFTTYLLVVFDFNVVYAICIMKLLQNKLELWNTKVLDCLEAKETRIKVFSKRIFQAFVDILECYDIHKHCCQEYILYYIIEVLIHALIYIEVVIQSLQICTRNNNRVEGFIGLIALLSWLCKNLTLQTMFMQRCENFYSTLQQVRDSCAVILMSDCSEDERRMCKNVLRLHRASFCKMRVCGLFFADVTFHQSLTLTLVGLLANYSVVLLQFAFL